MSRPCTVCTHPGRAEIEQALVTGTPRLAVARQCGLSEAAVRRHAAHHLPARLIEAERRRRTAADRRLRDRVERLVVELEEMHEQAEARCGYCVYLAGPVLARSLQLAAAILGKPLDLAPGVTEEPRSVTP